MINLMRQIWCMKGPFDHKKGRSILSYYYLFIFGTDDLR